MVREILGLEELWSKTLGDPRICIAILDGPVDLSHPCFAGANLRKVETLVAHEGDIGPATQHGTHIASILFGQHGSPIKGIAPGCRGLIAPIFKDVISGSPVPCSQIDLARAILQVAQAGANVINVSGGQFSPSGTAHPILADAIGNCSRNGVLIVAAAGNDGCECLHIPGALPSVLAVGAMDSKGEPIAFSNWGTAYQSQGLLAPGKNIEGAMPGGATAAATGTSFATPIVSGIAALLLSLPIARRRKPEVGDVRDALLQSSLGCENQQTADCRRLLTGRLNVRGAISIIESGVMSMSEQVKETGTPGLAEEKAIGPSIVHPPATLDVSRAISHPPAPVLPKGEGQGRNGVSQQALANIGQVAPSACGCGASTQPRQLVFALGQIGHDFGTEARRDSFVQAMQIPGSPIPPNPHDPNQLLEYLGNHAWEAASLIWTLTLDATHIYSILPVGPFAEKAYEVLRQFLKDRLAEGVERVSVPGVIVGQIRLMNGQTVPAIQPEIRGMFSWTTKALVDAVVGKAPEKTAPGHAGHVKKAEGVDDFLDRVYFELRNLGLTPQERAINYAATNAFNIERVFESAMKEDMDLDSIEVERSGICRPDSDCWDVKLIFFFPDRQVQTVRKAYRFTVDVSDVIPVTVGPVRSWFIR
ncbi:peptidase S8 [Planctomycetaceae bacterium SCGC AG-212-F19]|nr:peptidase S8 [Planctomycetaceae bacterium SCGC AG-212-F19]